MSCSSCWMAGKMMEKKKKSKKESEKLVLEQR